MVMCAEREVVELVDKCVWVVLVQNPEGLIEIPAAYIDDEKARKHVARIKQDGGYAWYRQAFVEG